MNRKIKKECDSTCEYILPDYMGDIRKVLMSRAKAVPTGKFTTDGNLVLSGMVEYEILYADSENKLTAVSANSDYEINIPEDTERYIDSSEKSCVQNLAIRVTGPRKISMKATVGADVCINESSEIKVKGDVFEGEREVERATRVINISESLNSEAVEREYAEEAERIPLVKGEEVEILTSGGSVRIIEARSVENGVNIKGELIIGAIIRTPEQPAVAIRKVIPFEETVTLDGAVPDMQTTADGYVSSVSFGVNEEGEECVIVANVIAEYSASVYKNGQCEVVTDAYDKECATANKYSEMKYRTLGACKVFELPISSKISRESVGCQDASMILVSNAEIKGVDAKYSAESVNFGGEIAVCAIACENNVDGTQGYIPVKFTIPIEEKVTFDEAVFDDAVIDFRLVAVDSSLVLDADDIYVKVLLSAHVNVESESQILRLEECFATEETISKVTPSHITVYYPTSEDTLFSVAKKYHTTVSKIASDNQISESVLSDMGSADSLVGIKKLIIR